MAEYDDKDFLEFVVKHLVDNPDQVKVDRKVDEMGVLLTLDVSAEDMGKIIGRSGNTAKAIRTLLRVVGMKNNARVNLKINEPEGGTGGSRGITPDAETTPNEESFSAESVDEAIGDLKAEM